MTTSPNGYELGLYFKLRVANGQCRIIDDSRHGYAVIGCEYKADGDRVFIEIDPNDYCKNVKTSLRDVCWFAIKPTKIIFNGPATIVLWNDGTKTVVKCTERETFDYEKGVALCYMKRLLGNGGSFKHVFKKFNVPK